MRILRSTLILCQILLFSKGSHGSPLLLYANLRDIRLVDAGDQKDNSTVVISGLQDVAAADFIFRDQTIYWTDITRESVQRTSINESQIFIDASQYKPSREATDIITTGLLSPDGLACDWLNHKLYWTDSDHNQIEVSTLDGAVRKVLFWQELDQPRAIALDPIRGYMYWTDWGELPKIERAGMDGNLSSRSVLVKDNMYWPNGLTLDYTEERVYWMDAELRYIHSMNFDGSDRQAVVETATPHPFAITLFEDHIYWTDWETKSIHTCNKNTGLDRKVIHSNIFAPMDIHVFDPKRQPTGVNPCGVRNGGCSHLCLISPFSPFYTCACPTGVLLQEDNKTCWPGPQELLLLVRRPDIRRISLDTPDFTDIVLQLTNIKHAIAIDYDPIEGYFYWTDDEVTVISRARLNGSDQEVLLSQEIYHPDGIAVDWIARNLYWTDTGTNRIEVSRLNGSSRRVLVSNNLQEPRAITVDPVAGRMYWTDWGEDAKIESANLDGTDRLVLVNESLGWPNGIALDFEKRMVFWGDAREDRIEGINMDGTNRRVLIEGDKLPHIFGFSLLGDYIYWTDWQRRSVQRINKNTGKNPQIIIEELPDVMGLKAVNVRKPKGNNSCGGDNFGCSHLCLYRPQGAICSCPIGYELVQDGKTCLIPDAFLLFSRREDIRRISLETTENNDVAIPLNGVKEATALDFDIHDDRIYWTDVELHSISRAFMNGSALEHIIQFGLNYPEGMAVDWIARNLYWADTGTKRIEMSRLDGTSRKVLVWSGRDNPRSIALDPSRGYMYWSNWEKPARIERATLDGGDRTVLLSDMGRANGLTIDFNELRIYWTDLDNQKIVSADMDGGNVRVLVSEMLPQPYSLTQYDDFIYWADWNLKSIERANKTSGENRSTIQSNLNFVMDLLVFHSSRQSGWNPCANQSGCSHLCVAHPPPANHSDISSTHHCACPTHFTLLPDRKTCKGPSSYLLFSMRTSVSRLILDTPDAPDVILPLTGPKNVKSIAYDPAEGYVYWVDGKSKEVKRTRENHATVEAVIDNDNKEKPPAKNPYDIAIDPYGRYLYWTDDEENVINVSSLVPNKFHSIGTVVSGKDQKPRKLALDPVNGLMFWVNTVNPTRIEKSVMDGELSTVLIEMDLGDPCSLALDPENKKIYWADCLLKVIEVANYDGGQRRCLKRTDISQPIGLAVRGDYVYWIDKGHQRISRMDKNLGENPEIIQSRVSQLSDIDFVQTLTAADRLKHPCSVANGNCSHLCFLEGSERRCSCPIGLKLGHDMETCSVHTMCTDEQFECVRDSKCIAIGWRCDGQPDCKDNSDELNCRECTDDEFKCGNGKCIPQIQRCDGMVNCGSERDEENCCHDDMQFTCADGTCIDVSAMCDGHQDCSQGEDESQEECPFGQSESISQRKMQPQVSALIVVAVLFLVVIFVVIGVLWCKKKREPVPRPDDMNGIIMVAEPYTKCHYTADPCQITPPHTLSRGKSGTTTCLTVTSGNATSSQSSGSLVYDRNHVTGASSSSSTVTQYPHETLNPPPSPVTDRSHAACDVFSFTSQSPSTTRSYRHPQSGKALRRHHHYNFHHHHHHGNHHRGNKKSPRQLAPPTTPCSTDVCDDSEAGGDGPYSRKYYPLSDSNYESDPFYPPPPTPRSQCFSEEMPSCPPSPSTERSFFNPYPPPPSPVAFSDC